MKTNITLLSTLPSIPKDVIPPPKDTAHLPPLPDGVTYDDPAIRRITESPLPLVENDSTNTSNKVKQKNYVSRALINALSLSLGREVLAKLPYEDNGRITFENLVIHLSKKDSKEIDNAKTDIQIIDKQIELLLDMKIQAKKSTQDGQTSRTRESIANYIRDRLNIFDELSNKASFNNRPLNKVTNDLKIGAIRSDNIGNTRFETGANILEPKKVSLSFLDSNNKQVNIREVEIGVKGNTGLGVLTEAINDNYDKLKIKASWSVESTAHDGIKPGKISNMKLNNIHIGTINDVLEFDRDGKLIASINNIQDKTGVKASVDPRGHLVLNSMDGRGITMQGDGLEILSLDAKPISDTSSTIKHSNYGKLSLVKNNSNDIKMVDNKATKYIGFSKDKVSESTINLRYLKGTGYSAKEAFSIGASSSNNSLIHKQIEINDNRPYPVTAYHSAIASLEILDSSILQLQEIKHILNANKQTPIYEETKTNKGVLVSKYI